MIGNDEKGYTNMLYMGIKPAVTQAKVTSTTL
jgi:hypothetical protein